ncbi:hypothetical protein L915_09107, partial [Phytophthora nicotianae]
MEGKLSLVLPADTRWGNYRAVFFDHSRFGDDSTCICLVTGISPRSYQGAESQATSR